MRFYFFIQIMHHMRPSSAIKKLSIPKRSPSQAGLLNNFSIQFGTRYGREGKAEEMENRMLHLYHTLQKAAFVHRGREGSREASFYSRRDASTSRLRVTNVAGEMIPPGRSSDRLSHNSRSDGSVGISLLSENRRYLFRTHTLENRLAPWGHRKAGSFEIRS